MGARTWGLACPGKESGFNSRGTGMQLRDLNKGLMSALCFKIISLSVIGPVNESVQFISVTQSCPTLCDPMNCSTPGLPVHHQLQKFIH